MEEELQNQKLTNQMFVQAKEEETSLSAATFVSVGGDKLTLSVSGPPSLPPIITNSVLKSPNIADKDPNEVNKDKNEEKDFIKRCPTPVTVTFFGQNDGKLEICQVNNSEDEKVNLNPFANYLNSDKCNPFHSINPFHPNNPFCQNDDLKVNSIDANIINNETRNNNEKILEKPSTPLSPNLSKVSPWLVSSEIISSPVSNVNTTEASIVRKSVITTQL